MTRSEMVEFFARREQAYHRLDVAAWVADHAEDGTYETPMAGVVKGHSDIESVFRTWVKAFPDLKINVQQTLIDGDNVVQVGVIEGSDTGGFMGLPPTRRSLRFPVVMLYTMKGDKIAKLRTIYDFTGVLIQLGVLKAKAM